jgi:hypothetical protein
MTKALNTIFGIGTAVVVFILILLGIQAFYPAPQYEDYCNDTGYYEPYGLETCPDNITVGECRLTIKENEYPQQSCYEEYNQAEKSYSKNFFIIVSILGVILLVISYLLFNLPNIGAGIAFAGIVLIMFSFIRGWQGTDDMLKFFVGLIITTIVIIFSLKTNQRITNKKVTKKKK